MMQVFYFEHGRNFWIPRLIVPLMLLAFALSAIAQIGGTASIYGSVRDRSEAVVPEASVVIRNETTGVERRTASTATGDFVATNLQPGAYTISISKDGFKTFDQRRFTLQVDQRARVDAVLELGSVSERVQVTGEPPLIESSVATLKDVVDVKRMSDLPLNGRNPLELTLLVPGVQPTGGSFINQGHTGPNQQFISASGGRGNTVAHTLDGGDNSDSYTNVANVYPNPDALQEFSFQMNSFSPEYGRRLGGVVNAITRSGTNSLHGSLFEYLRNQKLNATNFFTPGVPDGLKRNQYGASVGGPIIKDKMFFFGAWQATKIRQLPTTTTAIVPTQAMRSGDFSNLRTGSGTLVTVRDPTTGQPFSQNQIPVNRFDPIAAKLLPYIPVSTSPDGLLRYPVRNILNDDQILMRLDHTATSSDRLSLRYLYDTLRRGDARLEGTFLGGAQGFNFITHNVTLSDTHIFSPRLLGVFSFTFNRLWDGGNYEYPTTLRELGANIVDLSPGKDINVGVTNFFSIAGSSSTQLTRNNFQFQGALTYIHGRHELKFGADILRQRFNIPAAPFTANGSFTFANQNTGSNLTDFFLGRPSLFSQVSPWAEALRATCPGFYFQDNFKATRRLTLNLGLRWEPLLPWVDVRNYASGQWVPGAQSTRAPGLPRNYLVVGDPGVPEGGYSGSLAKFDPRFGFAYLFADNKTSLRGGFGIFHEYPNSVVNNRFAVSAPFVVRVDIQNPPSIVNPFTSAQPNPFPTPIPPPPGYIFPRPMLITTYAQDFTNAYAEQWNLTIEHQVASGWLGRVSYIGSRGIHLMANQELNPARFIPGASTTANINERRPYYPDYTSVFRFESTGVSDYNGASLSVQKRFSHGYTILASYTFSKSTDFVSAIVAGGSGPSYSDPNNHRYDHGLSDYDHTHRFVTSYIWELPVLNGSPSLVRHTLGGWQTNGIITLQSGTPFSVVPGSARTVNGVGGDRADIIGDPNLDTGRSKGEKIARYFNTAAFRIPDLGNFGTQGRNILRGPGTANVDFSVFKNFPLREQVQLQFRTECFNLFNGTALGTPTTSMTSSVYGRITSAGSPRILQLALRLSF